MNVGKRITVVVLGVLTAAPLLFADSNDWLYSAYDQDMESLAVEMSSAPPRPPLEDDVPWWSGVDNELRVSTMPSWSEDHENWGVCDTWRR